MKLIKILYLVNNLVLISEIEEVASELGEPDCKLTNPFVIKSNTLIESELEPFMMDFTTEKSYMISSDKILTLAEPKLSLLKKYEDLTTA